MPGLVHSQRAKPASTCRFATFIIATRGAICIIGGLSDYEGEFGSAGKAGGEVFSPQGGRQATKRMIAKDRMLGEEHARLGSSTPTRTRSQLRQSPGDSLVFSVNHSRCRGGWAHSRYDNRVKSQRPEEELSKGPDGIWAMPREPILRSRKSRTRSSSTAGRSYQSEAEQFEQSTQTGSRRNMARAFRSTCDVASD